MKSLYGHSLRRSGCRVAASPRAVPNGWLKRATSRASIGVAAVAWAVALLPRDGAADLLLDAARSGELATARLLLNESADPNEREADGTSALHWAVHNDDRELADLLLDAGADPNAVNRYGVPVIHLAAENGSADLLRRLLDAGADAQAALPEGETILMTAARTGDTGTLGALLEAGADANAVESWKSQTALMWAAAENNADAVAMLLAAGADRDALSKSGEFTALGFAVRHGAIDAMQVLLESGADANQLLADGTSLLVLAVTNAHWELAAALLEAGADPNAAAQGWTALHQLAWSRRWNMGFNLPGPFSTGDLPSLDLADALVRHGANIDARQTAEPIDGNRNKLDRIGATAFLLAAKSNDLPLMRRLLELGADPSIPPEDGTTALMAAAGVGIWAPGENPGTHEESLAAIELAFSAGGGAVNDINDHGDTALHGAVYRGGNIAAIQFLVDNGAALDVVNELGWMPVTVADGVEYTPAVLKRYPEAAALLRQMMSARGIDVPESSQPGG